jgi:SNF2-related domain
LANEQQPVTAGEVLYGSLFSEPMRVVTISPVTPDTWELGLVGDQTQLFRRVRLTTAEIRTLKVQNSVRSYAGDCELLQLGLQAYSLGIAYEFDPYFGLSISRVDPLPHQLEAVYDYLLKLVRVRFLLADDAGAGKTIMASLLLRERKLRGLVNRVLVVCSANLAFQWQRELREKFDEQFVVLKGGAIREQFCINQWLDNRQVITSLDLAKRENILPGLRQVSWNLVIVDEAHRMSWTPPVDGLGGDANHEWLFAVEVDANGPSTLRNPGVLGNLVPASPPADLPPSARLTEPCAWLNEHGLVFLLSRKFAPNASPKLNGFASKSKRRSQNLSFARTKESRGFRRTWSVVWKARPAI